MNPNRNVPVERSGSACWGYHGVRFLVLVEKFDQQRFIVVFFVCDVCVGLFLLQFSWKNLLVRSLRVCVCVCVLVRVCLWTDRIMAALKADRSAFQRR